MKHPDPVLSPPLPPPLEPIWESVLARVASRATSLSSLAVMVERLSRRDQGEDIALARADELLARLAFGFPRDLLTMHRPIHELLRQGALPARPLRVLDVAAGLGASAFGLVRAVAGAHAVRSVTAVDPAADALALLRRVHSEAMRAGVLPVVELETREADLTAPTSLATSEPFDVILAVNAFRETPRTLPDETTRGLVIADRVEALVRAAPLAPDGIALVLEPATRTESRALHWARNELIARGYVVVAPCTHAAACPMLSSPRDGCHEDLPVSLPAWLVPVAREAGLRWERLMFTSLAVRPAGSALPAVDGFVPVRVVSTPRRTKGKTEAILCGAMTPDVTGTVAMELDRDADRDPEVFQLASATRGDRIHLRTTAALRARPGHPMRVRGGDLTPQ